MKLFIPGPTYVSQEVREAQAAEMIGHRSQDFVQLFNGIQSKLRSVFQTENRVYVAAASGTGLWEGAMRNVVGERMLICVCGAFGKRWVDVAASNGVAHDVLEVEWGEANQAAQVEKALNTQSYDVLAVVHNETSTGVENPVADILAKAKAVQPDLITMVDAVSSAAGADIRTDEWGIDILVASSQKCFALPPGLAFAVVSDRALDRASKVPNRGWYFDFLLMEKYLLRDMTPATPAVSLLYALDHELDLILSEGIPERFARHARMAEMTQAWAVDRMALFAQEGYRSKTVTTVTNTRQIDVSALNSYLKTQGMQLVNGYGPLKDRTFRIGHMGEIQPEDVETLLAHIDTFLAR